MTRRGGTQGRDPGVIEAGAVLAPVKDAARRYAVACGPP